MFADFEAELYKASRLRETVEEMNKQVRELEKAKSDAIGETDCAKAEVGINVCGLFVNSSTNQLSDAAV